MRRGSRKFQHGSVHQRMSAAHGGRFGSGCMPTGTHRGGLRLLLLELLLLEQPPSSVGVLPTACARLRSPSISTGGSTSSGGSSSGISATLSGCPSASRVSASGGSAPASCGCLPHWRKTLSTDSASEVPATDSPDDGAELLPLLSGTKPASQGHAGGSSPDDGSSAGSVSELDALAQYAGDPETVFWGIGMRCLVLVNIRRTSLVHGDCNTDANKC